MNKFLISLFLLSILSFSLVKPVHAEVIHDFQTEAKILKDGTIDVIEYIQYDFGELDRHGIFRKIPYIKTNKEGKKFVLNIDVNDVVDEHGAAYKWNTSTNSSTGELIIKVGDPNRYITGVHKYFIHYHVAGALSYFSDHDELYWNATGNQWSVPVEMAFSKIIFLKDVGEANLQKACYTGITGSTASNCGMHVEGNVIFYETTKPLSANEGLTIVLGFPKGLVSVNEPIPYVPFDQTWYGKLFFRVLFVGLGILILFWYVCYPIWIIVKWYRYGRDPKVTVGEARAWFEPPKLKDGRPLTPGEVGALTDEVVDIRDISATIVDLARRGYLTIEEVRKKDFYLNKKKEYKNDTTLLPFEETLLEGLFENTDSLRLKTATLYSTVDDVKKALYESMVNNGLFPKNPVTIRAFYVGVAVFALFTVNIPLAIIAFTFGWVMPRKTELGAELAAIAKSLKNFLSSQERQLKFQASKQMMFEKLLPFAVAFGVEKIWAERFKNINLKPPNWYSTYDRSGFNSVYLTNSLNSSFHSISSAATPTSSSSGFSSGFSGGSSGGGGGGGGGGSW